MKINYDFIRQGDILLRKVTTEIKGVLKKHGGRMTIAYGEQTGHHHTLYPKAMSAGVPITEIDRSEISSVVDVVEEFIGDGRRFVRLETDWLLKHHDHSPLGMKVPSATYEIITEQEEDPYLDEIKKVVD